MKIQKVGCKSAQMKRKLLMTVLHNSKLYTDFHSEFLNEAEFLLCQVAGSGTTETNDNAVLGINIEPVELY